MHLLGGYFMQRKDVTPNSDKKSLLQKFGIGLAGGLLGGALILGGFPHPTAEIMRRRRRPLITATQKSAM